MNPGSHESQRARVDLRVKRTLVNTGLALIFAGSAVGSRAPTPQPLPRCDRTSVGMTIRNSGVTKECHLGRGWEQVVRGDPRLARIIDLPPDVDRNTLQFKGWVDAPKLDPVSGKWLEHARVAGTNGLGIVTVEVPAPIPHK